MAVLIQGFSVVVQQATLKTKYPGGLEAYRGECPNSTFCADDFLTRVGFMVQNDAEGFIAHLATKGLTPFRNSACEDVALVTPADGSLRPCDWLKIAPWGPAAIAWLANTHCGEIHAPHGWNADQSVRPMSAQEAREHLEFVRTDGNVDVYWDKRTGQELYTGRTNHTGDDRARHVELYHCGCGLIQGLLLTDGNEPAALADGDRRKLLEAVPLFVEVVDIHPGNWAAMWLLGKVHERLEEYERGLQWFSRAHRVHPEQPDVVREAAITAMKLGWNDEAVHYCKCGVALQPDNAGLRANLALAQLLSEMPDEALATVREALRMDPGDAIAARLMDLIKDVLSGKRSCPRRMQDLF